MMPVATPCAPASLAVQAERVGAASRLRRDLYALCLDLVGVPDLELLTRAERTAVKRSLDSAADAATEAALAALVPELEAALTALPESLIERLHHLRAARDCGCQ